MHTQPHRLLRNISQTTQPGRGPVLLSQTSGRCGRRDRKRQVQCILDSPCASSQSRRRRGCGLVKRVFTASSEAWVGGTEVTQTLKRDSVLAAHEELEDSLMSSTPVLEKFREDLRLLALA